VLRDTLEFESRHGIPAHLVLQDMKRKAPFFQTRHWELLLIHGIEQGKFLLLLYHLLMPPRAGREPLAVQVRCSVGLIFCKDYFFDEKGC
jgi:hypothetical protein